MPTPDRYRVFVSYHHDFGEGYKKYFCASMGSDIVDKSVEDGDIDPHLTTETIREKPATRSSPMQP